MTETKKNPIGRFIEEKLLPISTAFAQNRYVRCIGTGSQNLMAIIMIGAVFNLLNSIQIDPYQNFIQATGIAAFLNAVYNACMNFMGVFMVFSVGYAGAKIFDHDELAFNNGLMSLMAYLIMVPVATNEAGSTVVTLDYLGVHLHILALIVAVDKGRTLDLGCLGILLLSDYHHVVSTCGLELELTEIVLEGTVSNRNLNFITEIATAESAGIYQQTAVRCSVILNEQVAG